ncbi:DUF3426 domain-containing protein [Stutzerimonas nitrititolerans]|uniref:DUF3426 domain-containing protein n=1 Tax=Stutzerimonas nitrititolerans TaxID=2482751 RepID=UPI0028A1354F|nr:DUF3426 domain-containing protein [Stutzerimonas nitrititolerans]
MTSFITQCPHCRTSFRLNRAQLGAARGVVRCGACLEVFNASQRLQQEDGEPLVVAPPSVTAAEPPSVPVAPRSAKPVTEEEPLWIHDDLDLDNLDLDEELAKLEREERELSRQLQELEHPPQTHTDEAWAEQLLRAEGQTDESDDTPDTPAPSQAPETLSFTPVSPEKPAPPSPLTASRAFTDALEQQPQRIEPAIGDVDLPAPGEPEDLETDTPKHLERSDTPRTADAVAEPLFDLEDEPLQLDWQARRKPWGRWLGWGTLNLIALLALAGQYVAYNYDELVRQDRYRPWFEQLCPSIGCTLPPKVDIEQIKSSNLVVRSHPDFNSALVVDAIIYNRASFAQPFPLLEVRFADINGQPLASRVFKPGEYLSGELAGRTEMPPQVPIHIALDILDPGTRAVNYSLSFRSPE